MSSKGERTRAELIATGLAIWRIDPEGVNTANIAKMAGLTRTAVTYHFKRTADLRDAVAAHAVWSKDGIVVPMLIAANHKSTHHLTGEEKAAYLERLR